MVWFRVDDSLPDHPKTLALRQLRGWETAIALWTLAGAWASKHLTDGKIPRDVVAHLGFKLKAASLLVDAGFWEHVDGDYQFHEWPARNPLRSQVEHARAATRNRVTRHRGNAVTGPPGNGVTPTARNALHDPPVTLPRPGPTRPDPTRGGNGAPPMRHVEPLEPADAAAALAQAFADRTDRTVASSADMQAAHGIVAQVGDRWPAVLDAWLADEWVIATRPALSNLDKHAHKYTAPPPVDRAELEDQIRAARVHADGLAFRARIDGEQYPHLVQAAENARAVLEQLRARRGPQP